ncbi:hypothetical protein I5803_06335 [Caenimonas sp. DR4.4]|uniref:Uncharacterized protein n=1 Tax=Caenimonas aquaedulcis TaxID=2793270 RepID=A0A931H309_9BURK|nr:hypothetical protein [Caenimonas aquaedulcis]
MEKTDPAVRQGRHRPEGIVGWGVDLADKDRPAVPKERTPPRLAHVPHLEEQHSSVRVLHSNERPGLTPVYGTTVPPSGLSGGMRELAFRYSENDIRHWLILLAADRVNVGEGLLADLAHGHIPNIFAEMGAASEWKYNRAGFVKKAVIASALVGTAVYLMRRKRGLRG